MSLTFKQVGQNLVVTLNNKTVTKRIEAKEERNSIVELLKSYENLASSKKVAAEKKINNYFFPEVKAPIAKKLKEKQVKEVIEKTQKVETSDNSILKALNNLTSLLSDKFTSLEELIRGTKESVKAPVEQVQRKSGER